MHGRLPLGRTPRFFLVATALVSLAGCLSGSGAGDEESAIVSFAETEFDHELTGSVGDGPVVGEKATGGSVVSGGAAGHHR